LLRKYKKYLPFSKEYDAFEGIMKNSLVAQAIF
jgi:hypothetical protein